MFAHLWGFEKKNVTFKTVYFLFLFRNKKTTHISEAPLNTCPSWPMDDSNSYSNIIMFAYTENTVWKEHYLLQRIHQQWKAGRIFQLSCCHKARQINPLWMQILSNIYILDMHTGWSSQNWKELCFLRKQCFISSNTTYFLLQLHVMCPTCIVQLELKNSLHNMIESICSNKYELFTQLFVKPCKVII